MKSSHAHLGWVSAVLVVGLALPYAMDFGGGEFGGLDRFRAWGPGEVPLGSLWESWGQRSFRGLSGSVGQGSSRGVDPGALGDAVEKELQGSNSGLVSTGTDGGGSERGPGLLPPALRIAPSEYDGVEVEIENPGALRPFFDRLKRTGQGHRELTRVAHYGDSSIATDLITHTVRRRLQTRFGDGGHGFVLVHRGSMPYGHRDIQHRSSGWELRQLVASQDRLGLYGYGGVAFLALEGAQLTVGSDVDAPVGKRVSLFQVYYRRDGRGGKLAYWVDGGEKQVLDTRGETGDAVHSIAVEDGDHSLRMRYSGGGRVRLYGVVLERPGPGVVYDSLGLVGARARRLLNFDGPHFRGQLAKRSPDLVVLGFGGNEADDPLKRMQDYVEVFGRVIDRVRRDKPGRACLVMAPLDQAHRDRFGRVVTMETVPFIVESQRAAARAKGCAFYNTFEAMGGDGAMARWSRARPRLALTDYRHATPAGYEVIGGLYYRALLKAFAEYLNP